MVVFVSDVPYGTRVRGSASLLHSVQHRYGTLLMRASSTICFAHSDASLLLVVMQVSMTLASRPRETLETFSTILVFSMSKTRHWWIASHFITAHGNSRSSPAWGLLGVCAEGSSTLRTKRCFDGVSAGSLSPAFTKPGVLRKA